MNDRCFSSSRADAESASHKGTCDTLFVGFRLDHTTPEDLGQVKEALWAYFQQALRAPTPIDVRLHRHKETDAWKGTCHLCDVNVDGVAVPACTALCPSNALLAPTRSSSSNEISNFDECLGKFDGDSANFQDMWAKLFEPSARFPTNFVRIRANGF